MLKAILRTRSGWVFDQHLFSVVGTSRCDVRAACSGATPLNASVARIIVPPATTRAGTAQRAIPTIALNIYQSSYQFSVLPASCRQNETMRDRTICRRDARSTLEGHR